jgi:hypothetical protein
MEIGIALVPRTKGWDDLETWEGWVFVTRYPDAVLEQSDRVVSRGTVTGLGEGMLLERFVSDGDEVVFAAFGRAVRADGRGMNGYQTSGNSPWSATATSTHFAS